MTESEAHKEYLADRAIQTTSHVMMVRPVRFGFNAQTAGDNAFQSPSSLPTAQVQTLALNEFNTFVKLLREAGITVTVFDDTPEPHTPDSIFPNNWVSFHENGKIIVYPIYAENRRLERRGDILAHFEETYPHAQVIDFSHYEQENKFLESTGSMVMDRLHNVVYACRSHRTTEELFHRFCQEIGSEHFLFHASDENEVEIYHTNVMMALGTKFAVVCLEAIKDLEERKGLIELLQRDHHEVVPISFEQMRQFAGNMLQLYNDQGDPVLVMSRRAYESLSSSQIQTLESYSRLLVVPLDIIETCGGGSVRCMMAEVFEAHHPKLID